MSNSKCVYYKEKEQKSIDGGITWVDTGNFRKGGLISTQASQCGSFVTEYRWTKADYVCDNANKYKGYKQQVSHDNGGSWVDTGVVDIGSLIESNSKDCGYDEQWFVMTGDNNFICDGAAKYKKNEMKYTRDSGTTWNSFDPQKFEKGDLIEETSSDCASMKVTYTDGTTKYFNGLTSIEKNTDPNKENAKEVEIYDGVTTIGQEAFGGCKKLTSVTISDGVTSIGDYAFYYCSDLTNVTIGNSVTSIGDYAFMGCEGLTSVTIPNSVTSIGGEAFGGCTGLTSVTIPNSVTSIDDYAFNSCSKLTGVTIPDSVTSIGTYAFSYCTGLNNVTIGNGVKTIGQFAFHRCTNLNNVTIGNGVTNIGEGAFTTCTSLTSIAIPNSVTVISNNAFQNTGLASVTIPDSVTSIGNYAFDKCSKLTEITVKATTPPTLGNGAIPTTISRIYVPADSLDAYKTADVWKDFADKIWAIGYDEQWFTLTGDKDFICSEGSKYKKKEMKYTRNSGTTWNSFNPPKYEKGDLIESNSKDCPIPSMKVTYTDGSTKIFYGLTTIDQNTDSNKKNAKSVEIYSGVTSIGFEAFGYCYSLTSVTISDSVTSISAEAFNQCYSLTSITIPDSVKRIDNYAFSRCSGLTSVTIGNGVTNIGEGAFADCSGLTSVTIGNSVTSIGDYAFDDCIGLTSITIPDSVKTIGYHTFYSCSSLRTMTVNATTPPRLGTDAIPDTIQIIYVPADSLDAYKTADGWKDYSSTIFAIGTIPTPSMKVTYKDNSEKTYYNLKGIKFDTIVQPKNAKSVEIYDGVTEIGYGAFRDCSSLTGITISSGVTSIGDYAFKGCDKLRTMTVKATTPPTLGDKAISTATRTIYVPASSVNAYKSADGWSNYASKIKAISE